MSREIKILFGTPLTADYRPSRAIPGLRSGSLRMRRKKLWLIRQSNITASLQHPQQLYDRVDAQKAAAPQRKNHQRGVPGMEAELAADGGRLWKVPAEEGMAQRKIET